MTLPDPLFLKIVDYLQHRINRARYETFLVDLGFYTLSTLLDDGAYQSKPYRKLLIETLRSPHQWEILSGLFHQDLLSAELIREIETTTAKSFLETGETDVGPAKPAEDLVSPVQTLQERKKEENRKPVRLPGQTADPNGEMNNDVAENESSRESKPKGSRAKFNIQIILATIPVLGVILAALITSAGNWINQQNIIHATQTAEARPTLTATLPSTSTPTLSPTITATLVLTPSPTISLTPTEIYTSTPASTSTLAPVFTDDFSPGVLSPAKWDVKTLQYAAVQEGRLVFYPPVNRDNDWTSYDAKALIPGSFNRLRYTFQIDTLPSTETGYLTLGTACREGWYASVQIGGSDGMLSVQYEPDGTGQAKNTGLKAVTSGQPHTLEMSWELGRLAIWLDGEELTKDKLIPCPGPGRYADFGVGMLRNTQVQGFFDNIQAWPAEPVTSDLGLYDDFDDGCINTSKWKELAALDNQKQKIIELKPKQTNGCWDLSPYGIVEENGHLVVMSMEPNASKDLTYYLTAANPPKFNQIEISLAVLESYQLNAKIGAQFNFKSGYAFSGLWYGEQVGEVRFEDEWDKTSPQILSGPYPAQYPLVVRLSWQNSAVHVLVDGEEVGSQAEAGPGESFGIEIKRGVNSEGRKSGISEVVDAVWTGNR